MKHLQIKNISKSFGKKKIIDNFSLDLEKNEILAIVGKSGSGKSTLLNMIGLLEEYDSGEILLKEKPLPNINSKEATLIRRNEINYVFQTNALVSSKSVKDNLLIAMEYVKKSKEEKDKDIKKILEKLEILDLLDQKINTISGGEAQRVAIARCVLKPGDLILADEPTGSLDPKMSDEVFKLLLSLRDLYDKTIIIVSHDMKLANNCDRIIDIDK
ncbi:ABC transporter ATP-binding protein [Anaerococcus sp. Marseille-P3625]|uniref:ABC transporter ATP-binding protein n=1 Tax=Anaerococcus sp. Marseille-P3625 TaxID=1977277 RepID=UPI000C082CB2|nr:ATP-binding cassette domain-containing protein [Anaerococcus sp. Marseille-P3625]